MGMQGVFTAVKVIGLLLTLFYRPKFKGNSEMPKPGELKIQTSTRGGRISVVWGKRRLAGNLIWYDNFQVVPNYTSSGGKGGGGSRDVFSHYTYTVSFAFGICMGEADVLRIWKGKEEIPIASDNITVYKGTSDQVVDSHISSFVSRASAYRGLCYIVFEDYDLGQQSFLPTFTFEVLRLGFAEENRSWGAANKHGLFVYKDSVTGNEEVYTTNDNDNRIDVWDIDGTYKRNWASGNDDFGICVYNDEVFVADKPGHKIRITDLSGGNLRYINAAEDQNVLSDPKDVFVYENEVYVTSGAYGGNNNRIRVFNMAGVFQRQFGLQNIPTPGNGEFGSGPLSVAVYNDEVYAVEEEPRGIVQVFSTTGVYDRKWTALSSGVTAVISGIFVDDSGVYVADRRGSRLRIFDSVGNSKRSWSTWGGGPDDVLDVGVYENEIFYYGAGSGNITVYTPPTDVPPPVISENILTDDFYGLGLSSAQIDSTSFAATESYCETEDMLISVVLDAEMSLSDFLLSLCAHHNGYMTESGGAIFHNQFKTEVVSNSIDVDTDVVSKRPPVRVRRDSSRDIRNRIRLKYTKRDDEYSAGIVTAEDEVHQAANGLKDGDIELTGYCTGARAMKFAYTILRRSLDYPMRHSFEVGPKSRSILSPGAVFAINDSKIGWVSKTLRVLGIEETKNSRSKINAIEEPTFILDAKNAPDYDIYTPMVTGGDPGSVATPMVAELPALIAQDKNIAIAMYGKSGQTQWAGATVKHSYDNSTYRDIETNFGEGLVGVVDSVTATSIVITLSNADETLNSVADIFALIDLVNTNLCYVEDLGIYFRFATATLVAAGQWRLEDIIWNPFGIATLTHAVEVAHKIGFLDYMLEPVDIEYATERRGDIIYFKMVSFNWQGLSEDVSEITAEQLTFGSIGSRPIAPYNLEIDGYGGLTNLSPQALALKWRSANRLTRGLDYTRSDQVQEDADFVQFNIVVKSGATILRNVEQAGTTWTYTLAMWVTDGSYSTLTFEVTKICTKNYSTTTSLTISLVFANLQCRVTVLREDSSDLPMRLTAKVHHRDLVCRVTVLKESLSNLVSRVTVLPFVSWEFAYESVITAGSQEAGTSVANTYVDDNTFDHINGVSGVPEFDFYYKHADVLAGCSKALHVVGYYSGNSAHNTWLYIRNFTLGQWDRVTAVVDDFPDAASKQIYHFPLPTSSDYVSAGGEMWFRYYQANSGNPTHDFFIDLHRLSCAFDLVTRVTVTEGWLASKLTCRVTVTS